MKIDNRIFITPLTPFLALGFVRLFLFVAGVDVSSDGHTEIAVFCLVCGIPLGLLITYNIFQCDIELGSTSLGRGKEND